MNNNSDAYEIFQDIFTTEDLYSFYKEIDQFECFVNYFLYLAGIEKKIFLKDIEYTDFLSSQ